MVRYKDHPYAVQVRVRITFQLLAAFIPIIVVAFMPSLLTRPGSKVGLLLTLALGLAFFAALILMLRAGHRETTNALLVGGLFLIIILTYVTGAPDYADPSLPDRFCAVGAMQLAMCVLISERRRYLILTLGAYLVALAYFFAGPQMAALGNAGLSELTASYSRDVVIFLVTFVSLFFVHYVTHRTIKLHAESEERLAKLNGELEKLVAERSDQLINTEKRNSINILVSGISHQLNTPLGNIHTTTSALSHMIGQLENTNAALIVDALGKIRSGLDIITGNSSRMAELLETFRQIAVDQTQRELRTFNMRDQLQQLSAVLAPMLNNERIRLDISQTNDCIVKSYPTIVAQVVVILVVNAKQHGFVAGRYRTGENPPAVRVRYAEIADEVVLTVENNGLPISDSERSRLFEAFFTGRPGDGHAGLGLYIARSIVSQGLGGKLALAESEGEWTTRFNLTMPKTA